MITKFTPSFSNPSLEISPSEFNLKPPTLTDLHGGGNLPLPIVYNDNGASRSFLEKFVIDSNVSHLDFQLRPINVSASPSMGLHEMDQYLARTATTPSHADDLGFSCEELYAGSCGIQNQASRYGAYLFQSVQTGLDAITILCNSTALHAAPVFLNILLNGLLQASGSADANSDSQLHGNNSRRLGGEKGRVANGRVAMPSAVTITSYPFPQPPLVSSFIS